MKLTYLSSEIEKQFAQAIFELSTSFDAIVKLKEKNHTDADLIPMIEVMHNRLDEIEQTAKLMNLMIPVMRIKVGHYRDKLKHYCQDC